MKRDLEEEDLAELLQIWDDKREGPSNDGHGDREAELEPEHKIFLSHSGAQKAFAEQLCIDLERWQYHPFFDKCPDSLPKGAKFPEHIVQIARQCQVAVVILSEDFFTRGKCPMLELEAFVQSEKIKILPVYLGLSRDECTKNKMKHLRWLSLWHEWGKLDDRIDVDKWKDALEVLGRSNGIEYVQALGEVALREKIVSAIRDLIEPEHTWRDANVQGRTRIFSAVIERFIWTKPSSRYGVRVVGIYGMGGIGKTTLCKVLCDELNVIFEGRVFPGELGSMSQIELQKAVLRKLTDINHDSLTSTTIAMTTNLIRRHIRQQRVFLALDNVWQESIEEAKIYLRAGFHEDSIVMVTARSIDILGLLNLDIRDCMEMPKLEEEDAKRLFLHHVGSDHQFRTEDERNIQYCVRQCQFHKGENVGDHFHPLALKVLGSHFGSLGCDPSVWVESLSKNDKFNRFGKKEHPILSTLRRDYDLLCEEDRLLLMDAILYYPSRIQRFVESICSDISFDANPPAGKALLEQLLVVIRDKDDDIERQVSCIKAIGSLAHTFPAPATPQISALTRALTHLDLRVAAEAVKALTKFATHDNNLHLEHSKSMVAERAEEHLIHLVVNSGDSSQLVQLAALELLSYLSINSYADNDHQKALLKSGALQAFEVTLRSQLLVRHEKTKTLVMEAIAKLELYQSGNCSSVLALASGLVKDPAEPKMDKG